MNDFQNEWMIIHGDIEKYARFSLIIKLFSVLVSVLSVAYTIEVWFAVTFILVLWLQDGIWTTFQKRLEMRVVFVEQKLQNEADKNGTAFQFYSQWEENRRGITGLVKEYLLNAAKPTVAYPYVLLASLMLALN